MKNTKQKIIDQAKELFNAKGMQATTLRQIAKSMGISQGNLNYHFKSKQDIVETLYFELVDHMDREMGAMTQQFSVLTMLYQSAGETMQIFYEYRFLMRDMYFIFRENEKIRQHYVGLEQRRKEQFRNLFQVMVEQKLIRQEEVFNEYERLYERMNIVGDNWINSLELFKKDLDNPIRYYQNLMFEMIYPYLTAKGKREYTEIQF